jgi:hypothetical protein
MSSGAGGVAAPTPPASIAAVPPAPLSTLVRRCDNCGTEVTRKFCGACGQKLAAPVHSLWHFAQEAAEDVTHADSRLWRTLWALFFRPGFLTLEFLQGRRARYLPPLRLYLVLSVVFFLFASASRHQPSVVQLDTPAHASPTVTVKPLRGNTGLLGGPVGETTEQRVKRVCVDWGYQGPLHERVSAAWQDACPKLVADGGRSLTESYLHNLPRAMFIFMPLLAGVMMLLYLRPRHYYVEHLLLLLHNHAFVFLSITLLWLLSVPLFFMAGLLRAVLFFYVVWYTYRSMRVVYRQGRLLTGVKYVALALFYLLAGALMIGLDMVYSALTL